VGRLQVLAEKLSKMLQQVTGIEVADVQARDWQGIRIMLNSEGSRIWRTTGFTVIRVEGVVRLADGSRQRDMRWWVAKNMQELPDEAEMVAEVESLADWLSNMQQSVVEEDYLGPVLFEQEAAMELFSQLLPSELVGTPPVEEESNESSFLSVRLPTARVGRRLLPLGWSVVDDPSAGVGMGAYSLDLEGVPAQRVQVVEDGVVHSLLMSRIPLTATSTSTGHGRFLGNDRRGAFPAVVTVTPPKSVSRRALERRALFLARQVGHDYVLVVRRMEPPAMVEQLDIAVSGEAPLPGLTRPCEVYRLYEDGTKVPVRSMEFVGVDRRILRDIDRAGLMVGLVDTLDGPPGPDRFQIGPLGGLPVSWQVPEVLIAEAELVSRRGGEPRVIKF
jgi:hypothetical protein